MSATFPPYWGGTGNVAYHNARLMQERGHDVTVFTARTTHDEGQTFPFRVERLPALFRIGNAPVTPRLLTDLRDFDLIHLHCPYIFGAELTMAAAGIHRVPVVVTYHNDLLAGGLRGWVFRTYAQLNERISLSRATRLVATSKDYAEHSALARLAVHKGVSVVPNGVDVEMFRPTQGTEGTSRLGERVSTQEPYVLFVGGLDSAHHFKGVRELIEAVGRVPDLRAVIVGEGNLRASYQATADRLAPGRVEFTGRIPTDLLADLYRHAGVTVLPSTTQGEAFGMVLIESMASGTPVIATDLPGVRTVVSHGTDGLIVGPGDVEALARALSSLMVDRQARLAMGRAGHAKVVQEYDWEAIGDRLEAVYAEALESRC